MHIRFAEKKDLPQIIALCRIHAAYEQAEYSPSNKEKLLSESLFGQFPSLKCLVVAQESSLVGYTTYLKQFSTWEASFYIYLDCLFLREEIRGQGLGMLLVKKIIAYAKAEGCKMIQWQTPIFNQQAIYFYRKIGGISKTKERFFLTIEA